MTFAVTIEYGPDIDKITEFRPPHREYLRDLVTQGKLVLAGPFTDNSGGFIVYNVEAESEVEGIIKADPFYKCGVFQTWVIREWRIVIANRELLP
ncbi:MAG: YciI family protein [Acidobacteriota bacterium]